MDCIFCQIIEGKIPSNFVYEGEKIVAFRDINPQAPVHILIVPRKHIEPVQGYRPEDLEELKEVFKVAEELAKKEGVFESGFRLILNTGPDSGQEVAHLHIHLLGGKPLGRLIGG